MTYFNKINEYPKELQGRFNSFIVTQFDDSMSVEMQLRSLLKWIGSTIDLVNNMVDYLNMFIDQYDKRLQQEIVKKLNVWLEDGTLTEIINKDVFDMKLDRDEFDEYSKQIDQTFDSLMSDLETYVEQANEKYGILSSELKETDRKIDVYISPKNHSTLDDAIKEAYDSQLIIKADTISLDKNTSFRGVGLEIEQLITNGYQVELGDFNGVHKNTVSGDRPRRPVQTINNIVGTHNSNNEVFIRGASYQTINIGQYNGHVQIRMNDFANHPLFPNEQVNRFCAYNEFNFRNVRGVYIQEDQGSGLSGIDLWFNENTVNMSNTTYLILGDEGKYAHNMNRFYGGTFEGSTGLIDIRSGRGNKFYNIRGESALEIKFRKGTRYNTVDVGNYSYTPKVSDKGYGNAVITPTELNARLRVQQTLSVTGTIYDGGSVNRGVNAPFRNIEYNSPYFVPITSTEDPSRNKIIYESPFLDNPNNIRFLLESTLVEGNGFGVGYKYYDKNFNDITLTIDFSTAYVISTRENSIGDQTSEGGYFGPSKGANTGYTNKVSSNGIKNDIINVNPSGNWLSNPEGDKVHYVKFFVTNESGEDLKFYDLMISIFDVSGNHRRKYYQNYVLGE